MNKEKMIKGFIEAVEDMKKTHEDGTYYWVLDTDEKHNTWAIVLGWGAGFDGDEDDDCMDGSYRLCVKLAYQSDNSIMQCDYECDWIIPYHEETGEIDDTEIAIYPNTDLKETIDWLLDCYSNYTE